MASADGIMSTSGGGLGNTTIMDNAAATTTTTSMVSSTTKRSRRGCPLNASPGMVRSNRQVRKRSLEFPPEPKPKMSKRGLPARKPAISARELLQLPPNTRRRRRKTNKPQPSTPSHETAVPPNTQSDEGHSDMCGLPSSHRALRTSGSRRGAHAAPKVAVEEHSNPPIHPPPAIKLKATRRGRRAVGNNSSKDQPVVDKAKVVRRGRGRPRKQGDTMGSCSNKPIEEEQEEEKEEEDLKALSKFGSILSGKSRAAAVTKAVTESLAPTDFILDDLEAFKVELESKPAPFRSLLRNDYHPSVNRSSACVGDDHDNQCVCLSAAEYAALDPKSREGKGVECNEDCVNRLLYLECSNSCRFARSGKCRNQRLTRRQYKKVKLIKTEAKGFGLKVTENVSPGELVMELVGELIDNDECERRMWEYKSRGEKNFYWIDVGGIVLDAGRMGNKARFINHSCEPNCQMQKWIVNGELRLGIFAIRDIDKDEELSYDYHFDGYSPEPLQCQCGAEKCRGELSGKKPTQDISTLNPEQRAMLELKSFEASLKEKPTQVPNSLTLFINGRLIREEIEEMGYSDHRLFLTKDGPVPGVFKPGASLAEVRAALLADKAATAEEGKSENDDDKAWQMKLQELATLSEAHRHKWESLRPYQLKAMSRPVKTMERLGDKRVAVYLRKPPVPTKMPTYRRKGLLTLREKRITQVETLSLLTKARNPPTTTEWPTARLRALDSMVTSARRVATDTQDQTLDMNEETCFSCGGFGLLICCDGCCAAFHYTCVGLDSFTVPEGDWFCPDCRG